MRRSFLVVPLLVLSACGGSGGGDNSLAIESYTPDTVEKGVFVGTTSPGLGITFTLTEPIPFDAAHVHATVHSTSPMFDSHVYTAPGTDGDREVIVSVAGVDGLAVGDYPGDADVRLCRYDKCGTVTVHYTIHVVDEPHFSPGAISVSVPFGTVVDNQRLGIVWPPGFVIRDISFEQHLGGGPSAKLLGDRSAVEVKLPVAPPGQFGGYVEFSVWGSIPGVDQILPYFIKRADVTYEVTPNPGVICALAPAQATYHVPKNTPSNETSLKILDMALQVETSRYLPETLEYLSAPAEASGNASVNGWIFLYASNAYSLTPCGPANEHCLPPGTYQAVIHYKCQDELGAVLVLDHPVTMVIDP
jgi:hypothetical protein